MDANIYSILWNSRHGSIISNIDDAVLRSILWKFAYAISLKEKACSIEKAGNLRGINEYQKRRILREFSIQIS